MSTDPLHHARSERRPAVWPWLLLPLVVLVIFFALRTAKDAPARSAPDGNAAPAAPGEDAGSR